MTPSFIKATVLAQVDWAFFGPEKLPKHYAKLVWLSQDSLAFAGALNTRVKSLKVLSCKTTTTYASRFHTFLTWFINTNVDMCKALWVDLNSSHKSNSDKSELHLLFLLCLVSRILCKGCDGVTVKGVDSQHPDLPFTKVYLSLPLTLVVCSCLYPCSRSLYLSIYLPIYLSIYLSFYVSFYLSICLCIYL